MEYWDAYNEKGEKIGIDLIRGKVIPEGLFHVVVEVLVKHTDGSYLLKQRDLNKPNYPGMFEAGASGSVIKGEASKEYYGLLEVNIESLPLEWREKIYYQCAVNCVKDGVLQEEKKHFDECNGDMDLIYEKYGQTEYNFRKVIEKGRIYELGFPRCLCYLVDEGISKTSGHCECSRQSIIYILHELMPTKSVKVETIETVLGGAEQCRFRIVVE